MLARFGALTWRERGSILGAALLIGALRVALRACGVRRAQQMLAVGLPAPASPLTATESDRARAIAVSRLVDVAARHTVQNTCLHRSLALWWMLGRRGLPSHFRIGTRRQHGRFEAHAWVELGGVVISDRGEPGYAPLAWPFLEHDA